jgi:BlaI family transcriptional regulator, penicillinase repressor
MEVIWHLGTAAPAEVIDRVAGPNAWNHRTVRTLLFRLVEKGALAREGDGPRSVCRATTTLSHSVKAENGSFLQRIFVADAQSLLVHFAREDAKITPQDLDRVKRLLEEGGGSRKRRR